MTFVLQQSQGGQLRYPKREQEPESRWLDAHIASQNPRQLFSIKQAQLQRGEEGHIHQNG